jgi:hypothetical protein
LQNNDSVQYTRRKTSREVDSLAVRLQYCRLTSAGFVRLHTVLYSKIFLYLPMIALASWLCLFKFVSSVVLVDDGERRIKRKRKEKVEETTLYGCGVLSFVHSFANE